ELMNSQIDNQRIVYLYTERGPAFRDTDIARFDGDIPVFSFVRNGGPNFFCGLPFAGSKLHFLIHEIGKLKGAVIDGNKLRGDVNEGNGKDNVEQLSGFEAKHRAAL